MSGKGYSSERDASIHQKIRVFLAARENADSGCVRWQKTLQENNSG
jgi:hypothetical protein